MGRWWNFASVLLYESGTFAPQWLLELLLFELELSWPAMLTDGMYQVIGSQ